jgi:F-actin-capping protein subunit beta
MANEPDQLDCALDLMRRMPPSQIEDNLANLIDLVPDLTEHLLSAVDQPLKIATDATARRDYLLCDYNRDGDSYRSPWTNKYDPPLGDGAVPSPELRKLEVQANEVFDIYRDLYFEGGVSSVYCWDLDDGFAAVILIKKTQDSTKKGQPMKGTWDSIHVVEVQEGGRNAHYRLTSTVMLTIETETVATGRVSLAGSLTRQSERDFEVNEVSPHVSNIGRMVEDMELQLRNTLETIYFGKTMDIANELRQAVGVDMIKQRQNVQRQIGAGLAR